MQTNNDGAPDQLELAGMKGENEIIDSVFDLNPSDVERLKKKKPKSRSSSKQSSRSPSMRRGRTGVGSWHYSDALTKETRSRSYEVVLKPAQQF